MPCARWRSGWLDRGLEMMQALGLNVHIALANDPFFGRTGKMLAANQREQELKYELVVPITSEKDPTAVLSFNYHQELFGRLYDIRVRRRSGPHGLRRASAWSAWRLPCSRPTVSTPRLEWPKARAGEALAVKARILPDRAGHVRRTTRFIAVSGRGSRPTATSTCGSRCCTRSATTRTRRSGSRWRSTSRATSGCSSSSPRPTCTTCTASMCKSSTSGATCSITTVEQVSRGRLVMVEVDAFYLPDTAGVTYRLGHSKTTIGIQAIDTEARTLEYFHNAGYFGARRRRTSRPLFGLDREKRPDELVPYTEFAKLDRDRPQLASQLFERSRARSSCSTSRADPRGNPVRALPQALRRGPRMAGKRTSRRRPSFPPSTRSRRCVSAAPATSSRLRTCAGSVSVVSADSRRLQQVSTRWLSQAKTIQFKAAPVRWCSSVRWTLAADARCHGPGLGNLGRRP